MKFCALNTFMSMTDLQKTIIAIADNAKKNNLDPISAVQEYFEEKDSRLPRAKVVAILAIAREQQRKESRNSGGGMSAV